ncbi:TIGR03089 family protein [Cellulomonas aerilata]|uniref:Acyl-CoA synthetase n=1 Tax=Cellulomonas aerilata TaxID=515326 RepID=A0A512DDD8_9CELL|nr:TIGR03089 family protein [Cellulomonas aerilata]GEO34447.1 acyl-CoA synthetase [Cellulomonas aerilata]
MIPPRSVADVLDLVTADPGRPRLTWYGGDGERVELSGAVLANWVAKTTNLLVEELDVEPGVRVGLDLPPHWRTAVWALAAWRSGAEVALGGAAGDADVVVTDAPGAHAAARQLVAVSLPALARRFDGDLPDGAVDAAGAVMTYGDVIGWAPVTDPSATALDLPGRPPVPHADLLRWAGAAASPGRVVVGCGESDEDVAAWLQALLGVLAADGSVVALAAPMARELAADPDRRARLLASERVTAG